MCGCCVHFGSYVHIIHVQLLYTDIECPVYNEELLKVYFSDPVQEMEQRNKVSDIYFPLMYV